MGIVKGSSRTFLIALPVLALAAGVAVGCSQGDDVSAKSGAANGSGGSDGCIPGTEGCPSTGSGGSDGCIPGTEGCTGGSTGSGGSSGGGSGGSCTFTQGYWKNHPDAWPTTSLTIGGVTYTEDELLVIFGTAPKGDASLILAHQLIAALLNEAAVPNPPAAVAQAIANAQAWMAANMDADGRLPYGTPSGSDAGNQATALSSTLDGFNSGQAGVPHCGDGGGSGKGGGPAHPIAKVLKGIIR
jgi:hypothetical protein